MIKSYIIDNKSIGLRIDRWVKLNIGKIPQSLIEKNLRVGKIKLNGKKIKSSTKLNLNDEIKLYNFTYKIINPREKFKFIPPKQILKRNENQIIEDNENFIVINKLQGVPVQGGTKSKVNIIDILSNSKLFFNSKPYSVHRLDKDTSGALIVAKDRDTAKLLTTLFRLRKIHKTYLALTFNNLNKNNGQLIHNLNRYEGKRKITEKAITHYKVLDKNSNFSLLELKPITGRKHQIRKQLLEIGNPIVGDNKYYINNLTRGMNKNLMLHAYKIKFIIKEKKYNFIAPLPDYFIKTLNSKRLRFLNY